MTITQLQRPLTLWWNLTKIRWSYVLISFGILRKKKIRQDTQGLKNNQTLLMCSKYLLPKCHRDFSQRDIMYIGSRQADTEELCNGYKQVWCELQCLFRFINLMSSVVVGKTLDSAVWFSGRWKKTDHIFIDFCFKNINAFVLSRNRSHSHPSVWLMSAELYT